MVAVSLKKKNFFFFFFFFFFFIFFFFFFFFKQKTAYEILNGDWSSDVCSSDLPRDLRGPGLRAYFCHAATIIHDRIERSRIIDCSRPLDVAVNNLSRQKRA